MAIDPVLLSAAVQAPSGARILDAGCGTGAALFCALNRLENVAGVGLELQTELVDLAWQGVHANEFSDRANIVAGDLATPPNDLTTPFEAVFTNPPYFESRSVPPLPEDDQAHVEKNLSLAHWIKACLKCLCPDGLFAIIHRAERATDIIVALQGRAGAVTLYPLWPKEGRPAKRVIVTARKGRRSPASLQPGLVLHKENGEFTPEANAILRDGAPLTTTS